MASEADTPSELYAAAASDARQAIRRLSKLLSDAHKLAEQEEDVCMQVTDFLLNRASGLSNEERNQMKGILISICCASEKVIATDFVNRNLSLPSGESERNNFLIELLSHIGLAIEAIREFKSSLSSSNALHVKLLEKCKRLRTAQVTAPEALADLHDDACLMSLQCHLNRIRRREDVFRHFDRLISNLVGVGRRLSELISRIQMLNDAHGTVTRLMVAASLNHHCDGVSNAVTNIKLHIEDALSLEEVETQQCHEVAQRLVQSNCLEGSDISAVQRVLRITTEASERFHRPAMKLIELPFHGSTIDLQELKSDLGSFINILKSYNGTLRSGNGTLEETLVKYADQLPTRIGATVSNTPAPIADYRDRFGGRLSSVDDILSRLKGSASTYLELDKLADELEIERNKLDQSFAVMLNYHP